MPTHWTYCNHEEGFDLFQGDIIARTEPLLEVLGRVHRHFCAEKYLAFLVISQTCDLVVRKQRPCKARHISLAVIRALEDIVPGLLSETCRTGIDGVYRQEDKGDARDLLERIVNQNEQTQGIFYLHPDADVRIAVHAVALLRVSIALRSREHYGLLQESRCGRHATAYRNKLGWLVGNLFSRVDTPDWSDHDGGRGQADAIIDGFVDGSKLARPNVWVPETWLRSARQKKARIEGLPRDQVFATLHRHAPPPPRDVVIGRVREVGTKVLAQLGDDQVIALFGRLSADETFSMLIADRTTDVARRMFPDPPAFGAVLFQRMRGDAAIRTELIVPVGDAIARFQQHRGPRELSALLGYYADNPLLSDQAVTHVVQLAANLNEGGRGVDFRMFEAALRVEKPSSSIIDYVRSLAIEAISGSLIERLVTRLENDQEVNASLKKP